MKRFLFILFVMTGCVKSPPSLTYQEIPKTWYQAADPTGKKDKTNNLYSTEFKGPQNCTPKNNVAKCISNVDVDEEMRVKAKLILTINEMISKFEEKNNKYFKYLGEPCAWYQFACKKERARCIGNPGKCVAP